MGSETGIRLFLPHSFRPDIWLQLFWHPVFHLPLPSVGGMLLSLIAPELLVVTDNTLKKVIVTAIAFVGLAVWLAREPEKSKDCPNHCVTDFSASRR